MLAAGAQGAQNGFWRTSGVLRYSLDGQTAVPERAECAIGIIAPKMALSGNRTLSDASDNVRGGLLAQP